MAVFYSESHSYNLIMPPIDLFHIGDFLFFVTFEMAFKHARLCCVKVASSFFPLWQKEERLSVTGEVGYSI